MSSMTSIHTNTIRHFTRSITYSAMVKRDHIAAITETITLKQAHLKNFSLHTNHKCASATIILFSPIFQTCYNCFRLFRATPLIVCD